MSLNGSVAAPGTTWTVGWLPSATPFTVTVSVAVEPAVVPVKLAVYVPAVAVAVAVPNVPLLVPPDRAKANALLANPLMALPAASLTTIVTRSVLPEVTVDAAKLAEELDALTEPGVTVIVGVVLRLTPLTFTVKVLTVPAVVPVKLVV